MKTPKGMFVPVVTPFKEDQSIDFEAFKEVIDYVVGSGLDGILIAGSTGEYHTMTLEEQMEVIKKGIEYVDGRVPVMAGVGRYTAAETIDLAKFAGDCGATWGLVLPPYYQATTDENVIEFFTEIADNSPVGIVIYNNPLSTGVELDPELVATLAKHPNIVSIKDTSDMIHTAQTIALTRDIEDFTVFQGYEHTILPALAIGAEGGFAILMNALPKEYVKLYDLVKQNKWKEAADFSMDMAKLYTAMEAEPYPAPVKAMMQLLGVPGGVCRKPLPDASAELKASMKEELKKLGYDL
ncbi:MAG: 4-hydroxy-tetrahydrodipicolinate synthase [Firmicutes bacterium]|nr:4-hydroxy-tetrahydrodipicolinate synthase [Bacillota bacterium]